MFTQDTLIFFPVVGQVSQALEPTWQDPDHIKQHSREKKNKTKQKKQLSENVLEKDLNLEKNKIAGNKKDILQS